MAKRKASGKTTRSSARTRAAKPSKSIKRPKPAAKAVKKGKKVGRKTNQEKATKKSAASKKSQTAKNRSKAKGSTSEASASRKLAPKRPATKTTNSVSRPKSAARKTGREEKTLPTPPSSLNLNRRGSAARTGRAEIAETKAEHSTLTPSITGGDVDANVEDAYFTGDEAPGGDNPTPDQDVVDDIGRALGVEYQDNEELRGSDKVADRDKHRWELDPASSEDYRDRK